MFMFEKETAVHSHEYMNERRLNMSHKPVASDVIGASPTRDCILLICMYSALLLLQY